MDENWSQFVKKDFQDKWSKWLMMMENLEKNYQMDICVANVENK